MEGIGDNTSFTDLAVRRIFQSDHLEHKSVDEDRHAAALAWQGDVFSGRGHTWDQLQLLGDN